MLSCSCDHELALLLSMVVQVILVFFVTQVLEKEMTADPGTCLRLCEAILPKLTRTRNILIIADFMQRHLEALLSDDQWCHLWLLCAGCRVCGSIQTAMPYVVILQFYLYYIQCTVKPAIAVTRP